MSSVFHIHVCVGWVGEINLWTEGGCQWRLYMLTPALAPEKNIVNCYETM